MNLRERIKAALDEPQSFGSLGVVARELLPLVLAEMDSLTLDKSFALAELDVARVRLATMTAEQDAAEVVGYRRGVEAARKELDWCRLTGVAPIGPLYGAGWTKCLEVSQERLAALLPPEPSTGVHPEYLRGVEAAAKWTEKRVCAGLVYGDQMRKELLAPEPEKSALEASK